LQFKSQKFESFWLLKFWVSFVFFNHITISLKSLKLFAVWDFGFSYLSPKIGKFGTFCLLEYWVSFVFFIGLGWWQVVFIGETY
jgi:hypothetical protein